MARSRRGGDAYKQTIKETEDGQVIERRVFGQITRDLEALPHLAEGPLAPSAHEALTRNQQLWGALMFDVMDRSNPLPDPVKAGIISLALFVDRHTPEVLAGRKDVKALIEINRNVMRGLGSGAVVGG
jgi:flagellar protein FlaF